MKIIVIGYTGFVGQTVFQYLKDKGYNVEGFNSKSNELYTTCDIVINCAGNAKKYLAEHNYYAACLMEQRVIGRLKKIKAKKIIHISSVCAKDDCNYGLLKKFAEQQIKILFRESCILRLGGLVGKGLSKNVVYDLLNNNSLRVTPDSIFNFVHTSTVAKIIEYIIENWKDRNSLVLNVAANSSISVKKIVNIMKKSSQVQEGARYEFNSVNIDNLQKFFEIRDSEFYIRQYIYG